MLIQTIPLTVFEQCARIIVDRETNRGVVIDPGGEVDTLLGVINQTGAEIDYVVLTHAHLDHGGGVRRLLRKLHERQGGQVGFAAHEAEAEMRSRLSEQALMFGLDPEEFEDAPEEPDVSAQDGDTLQFGSLSATFLFTPGHSPGHISLYFERQELLLENYDPISGTCQKTEAVSPAVFSGDCLFAGSIGRTDLPGGNHGQLLQSIKEKLLTLPDDTRVFAGHGPDTTISQERTGNPFLVGLV